METSVEHLRPVRTEKLLTINQVSRRSGVAASALRYYEERGLIRSERAKSGHRRFERSMLRRIAFIVFAQRLGMSLDEIRHELDKLPSTQVPTGRDWAQLSRNWTSRIDQRIAELERLRTGLTECIACGCLSLGSCKLVNPEDKAASLGGGPRFWVAEEVSLEAALGAVPKHDDRSRRRT